MPTVKESLPPAEYIVRKNVFVLDPHTLSDDSGKPHLTVSETMLRKIAQNQNKRFAETGDATPLVIGHTKDGAHEHEQPEVVGYATNFRVTRFFKTGKQALACDFHVYKKDVDKVKKYPRRSVELWLNSMTIDPISLLGATTPERDLGLLRLSKADAGNKLTASIDDSGELSVDENTQQVVDAVLEAIKQTDVWQFMTQKMEEESGSAEASANAGDENPLAAGDEAASPAEGEYDPSGDSSMLDALGGGGADAGGVPGGDDESLKMAAGAPGGGNTFAPGMGNEKQQYSRSADRVKFAKLERENQEMRSTMNVLLHRYQRAEREKDLIQLESEGYMLDRDEELRLCQNLDNEQVKAHMQRVRVRYQKAPTSHLPYLEQTVQVNRGRSREDVSGVVKYAQDHGISYEKALDRLNGSNKSAY
jgi:predicted DNA binding CopG/RHH family protein